MGAAAAAAAPVGGRGETEQKLITVEVVRRNGGNKNTQTLWGPAAEYDWSLHVRRRQPRSTFWPFCDVMMVVQAPVGGCVCHSSGHHTGSLTLILILVFSLTFWPKFKVLTDQSRSFQSWEWISRLCDPDTSRLFCNSWLSFVTCPSTWLRFVW